MEVVSAKPCSALNTTWEAAAENCGMQAGKTGGAETSKWENQGAHLTIAKRRQDYSIALTKYFKNIVKLRERKAEKWG